MATGTAFLLAFAFSFVGSIPPGTLNLTILQLGLSQKLNIAWRFAIAAALVEYPYAWIAVKFEQLITSSLRIEENFQLIGALIMITLGVLNLWSAHKPTTLTQRFQESGFRRGIALSILNPLALPYWIAITAYLRAQGWIDLSGNLSLHAYLAGISLGALALLIGIAYLANKLVTAYQPSSKVKLIPGILLVLLGLYAFTQYLF